MDLRIAVVASGAIGSYYGAKLAYGGSDVHFLMRGDLTEVRSNGLSVRGQGENFRVAKVNGYNSTREIVYTLLKSLGKAGRQRKWATIRNNCGT
jgi:ketopantoate reductase